MPCDGVVLLAQSAWTEARLVAPGSAHTLTDGTPAHALDTVAGLTWRIDTSTLALEVNAPASAFVGSTLGPKGPLAVAPRRDPGAMLNYDVSLAHDGRGGPLTTAASLEAVAFGSFGHVVASGLVRDDGRRRSFTRLDTYWRYDMPEDMQTLVLGDTVGTGGGWSRPVRYGGIRWGRDFGMRPGFVTMPQLSLAGQAALPSTVDVMVNNALRSSQPVAPGPFDLPGVPVVTGAGEVSLVVRDLLGRETVVRQSYYASPRLLTPGLVDFSAEAGWLRTGYGLDSHYGDAFAAGTVRAGLTPSLTGEARIEVQPDRRAAGVDVATLLGKWGVGRAALAASSGSSQGRREQGQLLQLGVERSTATAGGTLQYEYATRGFQPFGEATGHASAARRTRESWLASVGGPVLGQLTGALSYVQQSRWDGERVASLGLFLNAPLPAGASIGLSLSKRLGGDGAWSAGVNLMLPLDNGVHTAARVDRQSDGRMVGSAAAALNPPAGNGLGWRVEASTQASQRVRGGLQVNTGSAELAADAVANAQGQVAVRAGARGTVGVMASVPFAARPVGEGSFAMVEVEGVAGVPVMRSNQV
ncbi:MAG: fimbrial biogenesis outer membrane usher protein, partial [Comamonadaceae bacterium]